MPLLLSLNLALLLSHRVLGWRWLQPRERWDSAGSERAMPFKDFFLGQQRPRLLRRRLYWMKKVIALDPWQLTPVCFNK